MVDFVFGGEWVVPYLYIYIYVYIYIHIQRLYILIVCVYVNYIYIMLMCLHNPRLLWLINHLLGGAAHPWVLFANQEI